MTTQARFEDLLLDGTGRTSGCAPQTLMPASRGVNFSVLQDNTCASLFGDDFEGGNLPAWSSTTP